jgi:hypothetical protein
MPHASPPYIFYFDEDLLRKFCDLDDEDIMMAIKTWQYHEDKVLSVLCHGILNRRLYKRKMQGVPFDEAWVNEIKDATQRKYEVSENELSYLVFTGIAQNTTYSTEEERINILFKDGSVKDISEVDNSLIHKSMAATVGKHYICWLE